MDQEGPGKVIAKKKGVVTYLLSANGLHKIACLLWLLSLNYTALDLLNGETYDGLTVLATGWLAPVVHLNLAWLANLFFFYIVITHSVGRVISTGRTYGKLIIPAWLAVICSLHTPALSHIVVGAQPTYREVYGYGWGAILWFAAIFVMAMAVGKRLSNYVQSINLAVPQRSPSLYMQGKTTYSLGLRLLLALIVLTLIKGSYDHLFASPMEQVRLDKSGVVFTRQPICTREIKLPISVPRSNVTLRLTLNGDLFFFSSDNPVTYLDIEGVKAVQLNGIEYQYQENDKSTLKIQSITQQPDIDLTISEIGSLPKGQPRGKIYFTLVDSHTGDLLFRDYWKTNVQTEYQTPKTVIDRCSEPSPIALIEKSLNQTERKDLPNRVNYEKNFAFSFKALTPIAVEDTPSALSAYTQLVDNTHYTIGCPADSGFGYQYPNILDDFTGKAFREPITAFKLNDMLYVTKRYFSQAQQALCKTNAIYTYDTKETILQKRRSTDYAIIWQANLRSTTNNEDSTRRYPYDQWSPYNLMDVNETEHSIQVILYDKKSKQWISYMAQK